MTVEEIQTEFGGKFGALVNKMSATVNAECRRLGCWGVVGTGTGAQLVQPGKWRLYPHDHLRKNLQRTVIIRNI